MTESNPPHDSEQIYNTIHADLRSDAAAGDSLGAPHWVRAKCESSSCLEVARVGGLIALRSSETRRVITISQEEWAAAVADIQAGGFGNLAGV